MIKPPLLKNGDKVAIVSLSSGMGGEPVFKHKYELGQQRLEVEFGLQPVVMPNALKGIDFLDKNPQARAADLMNAFEDREIKAIFCMIGGDDTIRLLPYINFEIIKKNPKIFMGYSDTTINHFMMHRAGLVSFYGPCLMVEFAENVVMHSYTKNFIRSMLFEKNEVLYIHPSEQWTAEFLDWAEQKNDAVKRKMITDPKKYQILQGQGIVKGKLLGGCIDVFPMLFGTELWPSKNEWDHTLLFLETSEECPSPDFIKYVLRGLVAQGIIEKINGIVVGKPMGEKYYEEYKSVFIKVIGEEAGRKDLPIIYNVNFGHNAPVCILPYGIETEINCFEKSLKICEPAVI
jgi:muramoyltetrapeptide carboxypeptidase LdcA involved in peptidoglycan recycling